MQVDGEWYLCDDGVTRPVLRGEVRTAGGGWRPVEFLVDTGADRTVLDADALATLQLTASVAGDRLGGIGGITEAVLVRTELRFRRDGGGEILLRGEYAAVTDPEALDMSVIGRDITGLFALIVDRPGGRVCLLSQRHSYRIEQT
jgi:Aspartyl protease